MTDNNHQSPTGEYNFNDYDEKMPELIFRYNKGFYPLDNDLPDPQVEPIIPGSHVALDKVGIAPVDLPIRVMRRNDKTQDLQATASLYCSLDDPNAKGLNLSRLYLLMHEKIKDNLSVNGIRDALAEMADKQGAMNAYCKLRFKYPWQEGHIAYNIILEGRYAKGADREFKFYLTVEYVYSSTCPCSFELAHNALELRKAAANAHSQRSRMRTTIEFNPDDIVWIEDLVELHREKIPTEVQVVVKRRDEQAFAELNGSNLLFSEDAVRLMYEGLDQWMDKGKIYDFRIITDHEESLHPWNAIALKWKGVEGGLR